MQYIWNPTESLIIVNAGTELTLMAMNHNSLHAKQGFYSTQVQ